jgi:prepilin-type N-terminal cleavage/methylation domain-containing protein/prepilin-type processing-associated H-X9-DG protein
MYTGTRPMKMRSSERQGRINRGGFTVVELLVVAAIISIVAALMAPALNSARESGRRAKCISNMKQLGVAFRLYQEDHGGKYPFSWEIAGGNSNNWQSRLGFDEVTPGNFKSYIPQNFITWNGGTFAKRLKTPMLCPTVVTKLKGMSVDMSDSDTLGHGQWGYCYNSSRLDISWKAGDPPYWLPQYQGVSLDILYTKPGNYAVLCDGNAASWNSDFDWNPFTPAIDPWASMAIDWTIVPVHGNSVNVLFMDAHVQSMKVSSAAEQDAFNKAWHGGIPVPANSYRND